MTTVDVYVYRAGDRRESFALHNGLFGPATTAFHRVLDACRGGSAAGEWSLSHAKVTVRGAVLRSILSGISGLERPYHEPGDDARLAAFRDSISDQAEYQIQVIEF